MSSRYREYDDDSPEAVLAYGRWKINAQRVFTSKRGLAVLAEIRDALLALPGKRLISGAMCTVGAPEIRFPDVTEDEIAERVARSEAFWAEMGQELPAGHAEGIARCMLIDRADEREKYRKVADEEGEGCCINGALQWYRRVCGGMDAVAAFASLPPLADADGDDPMRETAEVMTQEGLAFTMAYELAFRNDETYGEMTPEARYTAFLAWIENRLAGVPA